MEAEAAVGIAILARAPIAGEAKTRLIPALGAEGAARLQRWMLERTLATALAAEIGPVCLWLAGEAAPQDLARWRRGGAVDICPQAEGDLGQRMLAAVSPAPTIRGTLVIGTDCPPLGVDHLQQAATALRDHDAVVIPAEDGGYVLIGMKTPSAEAFADITWGNANVMAKTRQRFAAMGWRWSELATLWDVDRVEDVERLAVLCPEIRAVLNGSGEEV